jgi:hypothetical protein
MKPALLTSFGLAALAAVLAQSATVPVSESSESPRSCCAKKSGHEGHKMRCSLTGKVVDTCCCVEREGKTHCTLANKDVAECCCTPVEDEGSESAKTS